jgi:hypothetical protein
LASQTKRRRDQVIIPETVIASARERLETQGPTPLTPGCIDDLGKGKTRKRLCLAASLAWAGFKQTFGEDAAGSFERAAVYGGSKLLVEGAWALLDWDLEDCRKRMAFNDEQPDALRQAKVLAAL